MADIGMTHKLSLEKGTSIEVVENASPVRIRRNLEKLDRPPPPQKYTLFMNMIEKIT